MAIRSIRSQSLASENHASEITGLNYLRSSSNRFKSFQVGVSSVNSVGRVIPNNYRPSGQNYTLYTNSNGNIRCRIHGVSGGGPSFNVALPFTASPAGASAEGSVQYGHNNGPNWTGHYSSSGPGINAGANNASFDLNSRQFHHFGSGTGYLDYVVATSAPSS